MRERSSKQLANEARNYAATVADSATIEMAQHLGVPLPKYYSTTRTAPYDHDVQARLDADQAERARVAALEDEGIIVRRLLGLGPEATRSEVTGAIATLKRRASGRS